MADNTNTPTAAPTAPEAPKSNLVSLTIAGTLLAFSSISNPRGKGEEKGAPVLIAKWTSGDPSLSEILRHAKALGEDTFAKVCNVEILRDLYVEASKLSRSKNADGTWTVDQGKFAQQAVALLTAYTATQSVKAQLEAELAEIEAKIAAATTKLLELGMSGKPIPTEAMNAASQLLLARTNVQEKLAKKANHKKAAAPAPAPAPAATPAPVSA